MSFQKIFFILFFIIINAVIKNNRLEAQVLISNIKFESYLSNNNQLPFWLRANQNGIFSEDNNSYQILDFDFIKQFSVDKNKIWDISYGTQIVASYTNNTAFIPISYWADVRYKNFIFSIGAKPDPVHFGGLSSTNANLMWSNNARPLPHIRFSTNGFIPIFSRNQQLTIKAIFEENFLFDKRFIENAHLHHKNIYFKYRSKSNWEIIYGLDHWVFWAGNSPNLGNLPSFKSYLRYITGSKGSSSAPETDQINVSGNQLGNYYFEISKTHINNKLSFYWNHPFEDGSGRRHVNLWDGLWGFSIINKNNEKKISGFLIEFMRTMHQSGSYHQLAPDPNFPGREDAYGRDNYFNHSVYKSGFTHYGLMMGSPFFTPYINEEGVSEGFRSTRLWAFHLGIKGAITNKLYWHTMTSFSKNYGTYSEPFDVPIELFSYLLKLNYKNQESPLSYQFVLAGDIGNESKNQIGLGIGIQYRIR